MRLPAVTVSPIQKHISLSIFAVERSGGGRVTLLACEVFGTGSAKVAFFRWVAGIVGDSGLESADSDSHEVFSRR